jgi:class 3 adenylate cyclase/tetratricopeptide (TPR) repeat protein
MICQECRTDNEAGRKFCKQCGELLALACPACASANTADSRFCGECGAALTSTPAVAASTPVAASVTTTERRLVSVLFADIVGFTTISEHRDPEEMRDLLSQYFDLARDAIERHGGLVEKFIGDAVMAIWGTPVAHEDDAERAIRAALELVDAVRGLGQRTGTTLDARAAVLTGEAATDTAATGQGIVTGDLVNTASRLQSMAEPGCVLVGEATARAAGRAVAFDDAGLLTLKGKDEPVHAFRALRIVSDRGGARRSVHVEPPFVGRSEELRQIKELVHATGREGRARLVSVTGIGGIGKSRLAQELSKYLDGLTETIYWHRGRCPAYGDGVTFWALGEMVRWRAEIAETDPPEISRTKLADSLERWVADPEERRWIAPRLAHLLGLEERPTGGGDELFAAWRSFFEQIAAEGTVAMVFEDLQWADGGLMDFIGSMLEFSRSRPIVIVTLARPELADRRPDWGRGLRSFTAIHLEPLSDDAMAELVRGFVRGAPDGAIQRIVSHSEGVPLYAVETVRMLADRGSIQVRDDAYELIGELGELDIPETLQALIAARLDALPSEDRAVLQDAAVLGKSFTLQALCAVTAIGAEELGGRLRDLVHKELFSFEADPRSPERGQFQFVQALIREVAYGQLAKAERRKRHLAVAHHLEAVGDEELAGVVATHYAEAFRATPQGPDADELAARARDWLGQAATRAASLGSPSQALGYLDQALAITPSGPARAALLEKAGETAADSGEPLRSLDLLTEAVEVYRAAQDLAGAGRATALMAPALTAEDRQAEAWRSSNEALEALEGLEGDECEDARGKLCAALGAIAAQTARNDESLAFIDRALAIFERQGRTTELPFIFGMKAWSLSTVGRPREAEILLRGALKLCERSGDRKTKSETLLMLGILANDDDPRASLGYLVEGQELARGAGYVAVADMIAPNAVESAADLGEFTIADDQIKTLRAQTELSPIARSGLQLGAALIYGYRGEIDAAREALADVAEQARNTEFVMSRTWYLRTRSLVELMAGELVDAFKSGQEAIDEEPSGGNTPMALRDAGHAASWMHDADRVRALLVAAQRSTTRWITNLRLTLEACVDAIEGRPDVASEGFRRALDEWQQLDTPLDHAMTVIDALMLIGPDAIEPEIVELTRRRLAEIGAHPLLMRLESLVASPAIPA